MSAFATSLYEALRDHPACRELDNEQIEAIAHAATEHLYERSVRTWLESHGVLDGANPWEQQLRLSEAIREAQP